MATMKEAVEELKLTDTGIKASVKLYVYPDGHGNVVVGEANMPQPNADAIKATLGVLVDEMLDSLEASKLPIEVFLDTGDASGESPSGRYEAVGRYESLDRFMTTDESAIPGRYQINDSANRITYEIIVPAFESHWTPMEKLDASNAARES